jgi:hypothetical protein
VNRDSSFRINARWPRSPESGRTDIAEISIVAGERIFTQLIDVASHETRDFVRASAVSLAFWFADNWWRLRWEPIPDYRTITANWRLCHEFTSAPGGITWPPRMIYGVGERVVLAPIAVTVETGGPIEYLPVPVTILPASSYEEGLDAFFQRVIATCAHAQDGPALTSLVRQIEVERKDRDLAAWRRLEARLGYDPDTAPEGVIDRLSRQEELVGADAVEEAAVGCPGVDAPAVLERAIAASRDSMIKVDLEAAAAVAESGNLADLRRPIWMVAEDAAARLRRVAGRMNGPLLNKTFSEILAISWQNVLTARATARDLPYGARLRGDGTADQVALQTRSAHDRRFELARVLGDAVWSDHAKFGIISRRKTDRQKFQRAFAQSLLCPFDDLRNYVDLTGPTDDQLEAAARRYHVHRSVVTTLLVNKGFLPRETLGEQLEAA